MQSCPVFTVGCRCSACSASILPSRGVRQAERFSQIRPVAVAHETPRLMCPTEAATVYRWVVRRAAARGMRPYGWLHGVAPISRVQEIPVLVQSGWLWNATVPMTWAPAQTCSVPLGSWQSRMRLELRRKRGRLALVEA